MPFVNPVVFEDDEVVLITDPVELEEDPENELPPICLFTLLIEVVVITGLILEPFRMELIKSWAYLEFPEDELLDVTVLVVLVDEDVIGWFSKLTVFLTVFPVD